MTDHVASAEVSRSPVRHHNKYRRFVPLCSLERGAKCSHVGKTQKSFDRLMVINRQPASLFAERIEK